MNLKNLNVIELDAKEVKEIEGGWWQAVLTALAWSAWENVGDIREGFSDGYNGVKPRH
ncbi:hypothetical protein SAMN06265171_101259 [Chryseobacterium rhizoplanae]|uniref:Class IIb bacteriocin, lactobin A/cerein 7B family n=1 Tax=Chryseobacterium rhizoplanae TaxID=1609531 RepID=A0A521ALX2_9FLAO|nr:hypothetical protein [Chryseobacterium rhizoplanae]SMO35793.1 hypothetical protein SAMN06265171_101259 [Chryseobacterium rhizoplanae]